MAGWCLPLESQLSWKAPLLCGAAGAPCTSLDVFQTRQPWAGHKETMALHLCEGEIASLVKRCFRCFPRRKARQRVAIAIQTCWMSGATRRQNVWKLEFDGWHQTVTSWRLHEGLWRGLVGAPQRGGCSGGTRQYVCTCSRPGTPHIHLAAPPKRQPKPKIQLYHILNQSIIIIPPTTA